MSQIRYEFMIPDESKPLDGEVSICGPSCELMSFKPERLRAAQVVGRMVDEICTHVGTYGMGGPGFFGLRLNQEWLVVAVWCADSWIEVNGRIIADTFWKDAGMPRPWITEERDELTERLVGQEITRFELNKHSLCIHAGDLDLIVAEEADRRPILAGSKEPRQFASEDDLRQAVFLSPTAEIWV